MTDTPLKCRHCNLPIPAGRALHYTIENKRCTRPIHADCLETLQARAAREDFLKRCEKEDEKANENRFYRLL